jgi:hypothetical protein
VVGYPSGQRGQTVNLLAMPSMVRIHHLPPLFLSKGKVDFVQTNQWFSVSQFFSSCASVLLPSLVFLSKATGETNTKRIQRFVATTAANFDTQHSQN